MVGEHPQDDLLVVVGLCLYAREFETAEPRNAERAWMLAEQLAERHGLSPAEAVLQLE
ncbi:hypothetical protein GRS48_12610 [Halorubrum sp. JWXQ-INN 858]|uniref:hypothetical protein n=1 Tax=Halorubrum sp. JWXQ-INN 858 TaxID=2690782 RepID=UPI00135C6752|nr:hypothetical protein [Halorubrum sp. JWXQ-INN 858]MWV65654.1 hypothetical protein [Halorubrum sp. JWXQ-INN 858]